MKVEWEWPSEKYKLFFPEVEARHKCLYGGRGGGKDYAAAQTSIILADTYKMRILYTRQVQISIKDSMHKLVSDLIREKNLEGKRFRILDNEIRNLHTGSEFIFKGMQDIKSVQGVDIAIINEAQQVSKEYGDMLIPTIRNEGSELWWIWNPENEEDWVHQTFIVKTRPDTILQMVNYPDNLKCPKVLINEAMILKDNDYEEYRHIWLGELKPKNKGWRTFNPDWLDFAAGLQENKPKPLDSPRLMSRHAIGSDPAFEGVDSWVTIEGKGNKVLEMDVILKSDIKGKRDTDLIADNINGRVMRAGRFNCNLGIDGNGPGQGVCDRLEGHYGFKDCLTRLNKKDKDFIPPPPKGTACPELKDFTNWRAQAWYLFKMDLIDGNIDLSELARNNPKEYALLIKEILAHNIWTDEKKKMRVTPKEHLRKKEILGWSPGRADALVAWNWVRKRVDDYAPPKAREPRNDEADYLHA